MNIFLRNNTRSLRNYSRKKFLAVTGILSFLLFFITLLVLLRHNTEQFATALQSQLGLYLYVKESASSGDLAQKVQTFQTAIQSQGLQVTYLNKDQALSQFSKRLPSISESFEKYGIKNPLPSTLYISFSSQQQYDSVRTMLVSYEDVFEMGESTQLDKSFSDQQYRVSQVINLIQTMRYAMIFLILVLAAIVISFLYFTMRVVFFQFQKQLEIEKLLGMSYRDMLIPFLLITGVIVMGAFFWMCCYGLLLGILLNHYFLQIFFQTIFEILLP